MPLVCAPTGTGLDTPHRHLGDEHKKRSAFGLLQEFLNVSKAALWGLASDGLTMRIGRDHASLTRPAWIEIDLARIFTESLYPDFAAAWLVLHRSRFGRADQEPASCALETWRASAREEGTRACDRLRGGFEEAILALGQGFLAHPSNQALRKALHDGSLAKKAYFGELLRLSPSISSAASSTSSQAMLRELHDAIDQGQRQAAEERCRTTGRSL